MNDFNNTALEQLQNALLAYQKKETSPFEKELYVFQEKMRHYIFTGVGEKEELLGFVEKNKTNIENMFIQSSSSLMEVWEIQKFLQNTFVLGSYNQQKNLPLEYQLFNTERTEFCLEIMASLCHTTIGDRFKGQFRIFFTKCLFNCYDKKRENILFGGTEDYNLQHYNVYLTLEKIVDFCHKENISLDKSIDALNEQLINYLYYYEEFLKNSGQIAIEPNALEAVSQIITLYSKRVLNSDVALLLELKEQISQELDELKKYPDLVETIGSTLSKLELESLAPQSISAPPKKLKI